MARYRGRGPDSGLAVFLVGATAIWTLAERPAWAQALIGTAWVIATVGWWLLFHRRGTCGIADRGSPRGCAAGVRGLLRACPRPDHRLWKRELILRRLGVRPSALRNRPPVQAASGPAAGEPVAPAGADPDEVWLPGVTYHATMLCLTVVSGVGSLASVIGTLAGSP